MTAPTLEKLLTAEEFFLLPEPIEGGKMELVAGKVVTHMPVSGGHAKRASRIDRVLGAFAEAHSLGEVLVEAGFLLSTDPDEVRAPDIAFVSNEMLPVGGLPDEGYVPCAPTLAIEVISPNDRDDDVAGKLATYMATGVQRVWIVRKKVEAVSVHRPDGTSRTLRRGHKLTSDDAGFSEPGFELPIAQIFA